MVLYSKPAKKYVSVIILLAVNVAASLGDICGKLQPTFRARKQNFLVVVVHTWNKTWRRRKEEEEELRNRSFFSASTWGPGANVL